MPVEERVVFQVEVDHKSGLSHARIGQDEVEAFAVYLSVKSSFQEERDEWASGDVLVGKGRYFR